MKKVLIWLAIWQCIALALTVGLHLAAAQTWLSAHAVSQVLHTELALLDFLTVVWIMIVIGILVRQPSILDRLPQQFAWIGYVALATGSLGVSVIATFFLGKPSVSIVIMCLLLMANFAITATNTLPQEHYPWIPWLPLLGQFIGTGLAVAAAQLSRPMVSCMSAVLTTVMILYWPWYCSKHNCYPP